MYFVDKKKSKFSKIPPMINDKLMPKLSVTAKVENLVPNSKNNAKKCHAKLPNFFTVKFV